VVVISVAVNFCFPEIFAGSWKPEQMAVVSMPETPIDENCYVITGQDDVRFSRQIFNMEPEAESVPVKKLPYLVFWSCVYGPDTRHHPAAGFTIYYIRHDRKIFMFCFMQINASVTLSFLPFLQGM
jgi:hypothetical protein